MPTLNGRLILAGAGAPLVEAFNTQGGAPVTLQALLAMDIAPTQQLL
jgi:hypothetical protein